MKVERPKLTFQQRLILSKAARRMSREDWLAGKVIHPYSYWHPKAVPVAEWILSLDHEPTPEEMIARLREALGSDYIPAHNEWHHEYSD